MEPGAPNPSRAGGGQEPRTSLVVRSFLHLLLRPHGAPALCQALGGGGGGWS